MVNLHDIPREYPPAPEVPTWHVVLTGGETGYVSGDLVNGRQAEVIASRGGSTMVISVEDQSFGSVLPPGIEGG